MKIVDKVRDFRKAQRRELLERRLIQIAEMREELDDAEKEIRVELERDTIPVY